MSSKSAMDVMLRADMLVELGKQGLSINALAGCDDAALREILRARAGKAREYAEKRRRAASMRAAAQRLRDAANGTRRTNQRPGGR